MANNVNPFAGMPGQMGPYMNPDGTSQLAGLGAKAVPPAVTPAAGAAVPPAGVASVGAPQAMDAQGSPGMAEVDPALTDASVAGWEDTPTDKTVNEEGESNWDKGLGIGEVALNAAGGILQGLGAGSPGASAYNLPGYGTNTPGLTGVNPSFRGKAKMNPRQSVALALLQGK